MFIRDLRHLLPDGDGTGGTGAGSGDGPGTGGGAGSGSAGQSDQTGQGSTQGATTEPQDVASLPQWAQDHIRGLRTENAGHRTATRAAEQRTTDVVEAAKVALGLSEAPSPEQLGEQLRTAQAETRQARIEAAVARTAGEHGADPARLLDSRSFLAAVGELDPTSSDFTTKVGEAIKAGVQANPALKATPPEGDGGQNNGPRRPAPDRSQGSSARGRDATASSVQAGRDLYRQRHSQRDRAATT